MKADQIVTAVTERLIASLEKERIPWVRPWGTDPALAWPTNPTTHKKYSGFNAFWLNMAQGGYETNLWLTFVQAQAAGGNVRKGERGTPALRPLEIKKAFENAAEGEETAETLLLFRGYTLFNLDQCEGVDHLRPALTTNERIVERVEAIEQAIVETDAMILYGGNRCFYRPSTDHIQMVPPEQFHSMNDFYATIWHELTHWTAPRVKRDLGPTSDRRGYAREELVAELGSAFCCQALGIDGIDRHQAAYLRGWLDVLRSEPKALLHVARDAAVAYRFLLPEQPSETPAIAPQSPSP